MFKNLSSDNLDQSVDIAEVDKKPIINKHYSNPKFDTDYCGECIFYDYSMKRCELLDVDLKVNEVACLRFEGAYG